MQLCLGVTCAPQMPSSNLLWHQLGHADQYCNELTDWHVALQSVYSLMRAACRKYSLEAFEVFAHEFSRKVFGSAGQQPAASVEVRPWRQCAHDLQRLLLHGSFS